MTNNEKDQLMEELYQYLLASRNVGHTRLMLEGANYFSWNFILLARCKEAAEFLIKNLQPGYNPFNRIIPMGPGEIRRGRLREMRLPIAIDNSFLLFLFERNQTLDKTEWPSDMEPYLTKVEYVKKKKAPWYIKIFNWIWRI